MTETFSELNLTREDFGTPISNSKCERGGREVKRNLIVPIFHIARKHGGRFRSTMKFLFFQR